LATGRSLGNSFAGASSVLSATRIAAFRRYCFHHGRNQSQFRALYGSFCFIPRGSAVSGRGGAASGRWVPNTDVYATDTGLVIKVELAGMKSENLEITVEGSRLRISGNRPDAAARRNAVFWSWKSATARLKACWNCRRVTIWARPRRFM
jgi:hypothetical protein